MTVVISVELIRPASVFSGALVRLVVPAATGCTTPGGGQRFGRRKPLAGLAAELLQAAEHLVVDLRISRRFKITEGTKLELLGEAFNLFNRTQVTGVNSTLYVQSGTTMTFSPTFGSTTAADSTLFRERQVQLAVRFEF